MGIGRGGATNGLDQWAGHGDGAGVRVEQSGLQGADGVKEDGGEAAGETQRGEPSHLRVQRTGVCGDGGTHVCLEVDLKICSMEDRHYAIAGFNHMKHLVGV